MAIEKAEREPGLSPTINDLRNKGVTGLRVTCLGQRCDHNAIISFDSLGLTDDTPFVEVAVRRPWICGRCRGWRMSVVPTKQGPDAEREEHDSGP